MSVVAAEAAGNTRSSSGSKWEFIAAASAVAMFCNVVGMDDMALLRGGEGDLLPMLVGWW